MLCFIIDMKAKHVPTATWLTEAEHVHISLGEDDISAKQKVWGEY